MEEDLRTLKANAKDPVENQSVGGSAGDKFDGMSLAQLREYIASNTGQEPHGANNRKTLERLARDASPGATTKAA
jgi:hypothetical protein